MAKELLKPSTLANFKTMGSKDIVNAFIESNLDQAEVECSATGRDANAVYVALGLYLKRHPILETVVKTREDRVFLIRQRKPAENENAGSASQPS